MFETVNPATGEPIERYEEHGEEDVAQRLARAWSGFEAYREVAFDDRAATLRHLADLLEERTEDLAYQATTEMGKPIAQSRAEVEKCAWLCRHYADHGAEYLAPESVDTGAHRSYVRYDPLGPILAIMPWNFPYWQAFRHLVPAAMAGNVILLKHSANTLGVAHRTETLIREAGFPQEFLQLVLVGHDGIERIIADDRIRGVTLTGSVGAGQAVAEQAGRHGTKSVLELGGSDPFIVLDDAELDRAVAIGVKARLQNSGQSCIAAKRFIVHAAVHDEFAERFREEMDAARVGDPADEDTDVGPLAREDLRDELHEQVGRAMDDGARVLTGGEVPDRPGFFYDPTVIVDVTPANPAGHEELFGPVATLFRVEDDEEAIAIANATPFGLGASIWTADLERGEEIARLVDAGVISVNELVKSDPRLPFGGVKDSGYGRELGEAGAREFTNIKSVWVSRSQDSDVAAGATE